MVTLRLAVILFPVWKLPLVSRVTTHLASKRRVNDCYQVESVYVVTNFSLSSIVHNKWPGCMWLVGFGVLVVMGQLLYFAMWPQGRNLIGWRLCDLTVVCSLFFQSQISLNLIANNRGMIHRHAADGPPWWAIFQENTTIYSYFTAMHMRNMKATMSSSQIICHRERVCVVIHVYSWPFITTIIVLLLN